MDIDTFVSNFVDLFENTDASQISAKTEFRNLEEWSSLIALSLIAMVDEEYEIRVKGDEIRGCATVEDLFGLVKAKSSV